MENIENQIKILKNHIKNLMINEKQKHLYFYDIHFKKTSYKNTTRETRKQYIKEFLKNSYSNYIATQVIYKNKESYKVLINNYEKELLIKLRLRITDTIGTVFFNYIDSKNKTESNVIFYLKKLLNHNPKYIIKNNIKLNNIIYSKDNINELNKLYKELKNEKDRTKREILKNKILMLTMESKGKIYKTHIKKYSFYKYDINKIQREQNINKTNNI